MSIINTETGLRLAVASNRLDFKTAIEFGEIIPPVAFESFDLLNKWSKNHDLEVRPAGNLRLNSAVEISGCLINNKNSTIYYRQIWVRATYHNYRKALREGLKYMVTDFSLLRYVDADHVINRNRTKHHCPLAWVNLIPVWVTANRGFGWIEARLPDLKPGFDHIELPPLVAFKILRDDIKITNLKDNNLGLFIEKTVNRLTNEGDIVINFKDKIIKEVNDAYNLRKIY